MSNFSGVTSITLSAYFGMENMRPMYFCIFLIVYILIIAVNLVLITLIYKEKSLHQPMFFLLCNLAVNGVYGSTTLLPALLSNVFSHSNEVSLSLCQAQIYCIHTYAIVEFTILAVMSYDRYVAICKPLIYHALMSQRVFKLIIFTWLYPMTAFLVLFILTVRLHLCKSTIDNFYCVNYSLVRLSCSDVAVVNLLGLLSVAVFSVPQLIMIFYSYAYILRICVFSMTVSKSKALRTCTPHLFATVNYAIGCFLEITQSRIQINLSYNTKMFLSVYFLIFPALLNPAIYGMSIKTIRVKLVRTFHIKINQIHKE